jgi:acyl-CoA reductase-like NAD-dependent aldehyde dehydrogenase
MLDSAPSHTPESPQPEVGSPSFPAAPPPAQASSHEALDLAIADLKAHKQAWADLPLDRRIQLLKDVQDAYDGLAERWVAANARAKALPEGTFSEGEEWVIFVMGMRALNHFLISFQAMAKGDRPPIPGGLHTEPGGRTVARVFPTRWTDRLLFRGVTADVWMAEGVTADDVRDSQAWAYHEPSQGQVALVLAAGNLSILPLLDSLDRLFVKRQVVLLKTNPVSAYLDPLLAETFHPLIEAGYVRMVSGGAEQGAYLARHPDIDSIHMTGSDKTFSRIVFGDDHGSGPSRGARQPTLGKEISAELGNVTPLIIVPGPWTKADLRHKAVQLASWMEVNASFNCLSPRVIIQHAEWPLREAFLAELEDVLVQTPTRKAYYPGSHERHRQFADSHTDVRMFGQPGADQLPWTLIADVDPENGDDMSFRSEVFCGVVSETALHADSPLQFIERAVEFANKQLWGTLLISLFAHPRTLGDPVLGAAIERAISELRYGTVCLNLRGEYGYYPLMSPWGGAPGTTLDDPQSGRGVINNPLMFRHSQKAVVRGPFRQWPDPFVITFKHLVPFGKALRKFERDHALTDLPAVFWSALRG